MSRPQRPAFAAALGTAVGTAGGLIGLGGAEFRLPALVGGLRFSAREAVAVNLVASFIVLAAAFPFRAATVPWDQIAPHLPAVLGMLAGSMSAAWVGAGWLRRASDKLLGRLILILLVALGGVLIAEGLFVAEPSRLVGEGVMATVAVAAVCGVGIGLVSSLLGVAGGELIIPVFILLFGVEVKTAGSMSMLVGMPTIAVRLLRHFGAGSVLREGAVWRWTILPLGAGSILGAVLGATLLGLVPGQALKIGLGLILIWSAWGVFRHLPQAAQAPAAARGLAARVVAHDPEWGLTTLAVDGQTVTVPRLALPPGAEMRLDLADRDVTLALAHESGTSALNTLSGAVAGVETLADGTCARVRVAVAGAGEIAALVTRRSVAALGLVEGAPVLASFKATAVR
jgi:molybdopterin-binding protein